VTEEEPRPVTDADKALVEKNAKAAAEEAELAVPLNPEQIEAAMRYCNLRIARGVRVVTKAEKEFRDLDRAYDRAFAQAFLDWDGAQTEKRHAATLATDEVREARDVAYLAFQHGKRLAEALQDELRTLQSVNKSIIAMYGASRGFGS